MPMTEQQGEQIIELLKQLKPLGELAEKIDALNDKVESIVNDVADIEGVVSGRKEKFVNPIDL